MLLSVVLHVTALVVDDNEQTMPTEHILQWICG